MIVGNGLMASLFKNNDKKEIVFFASGVSNSSQTNPNAFERERNLILKTINEHSEKLLIYFSTCSIYDSSKNNSPYVLHKLKMEELISTQAKKYIIYRISNVVGKGGSPYLLINYLIKALKENSTVEIHKKATRNLVDAEDVRSIVLDSIANTSLHNKIINLAYPLNFSVPEIIEIIENYYQKKFNSHFVEKGSGYEINIPEIAYCFLPSEKLDKKKYLKKILDKYYTVLYEK
ncbi:MAG: NAD-dependent epimerase/dehydratase family protein [Bergeyella sp.]|nr:NAD-dependent epimerase/dehydratase family protein [Bergeyella sp.]